MIPKMKRERERERERENKKNLNGFDQKKPSDRFFTDILLKIFYNTINVNNKALIANYRIPKKPSV